MPGQKLLASQQDVEDNEVRETEGQATAGIRSPRLLFLRVYAPQPVEQALQRQERFREESPLSLEDSCHIPAERLGDGQQQAQEGQELTETGPGQDFLTPVWQSSHQEALRKV